MMNYFDRPEVSNSDLTSLKQELSSRHYIDPTEAYAFGTLVDAMITEPDRIDWFRKLIDGNPAKNFDVANRMCKAFWANDTCSKILKGADFQKVSVKRREFNWCEMRFELDCRCKWDWFGNVSGDIKSTAATTQKQFEAACDYFDYHRSRAWYMDIENTDRDLLIGISKVNYKIFFVPIKRGDALHKKGVNEYSELAFKYWMLKN